MPLFTFLIMVIGVSMNPTYAHNDFLTACTPLSDGCAFSDVKVGDVISFKSENSSAEDGSVHRVIALEGYYVVTQGDNRETNPKPIPELDYVTSSEYLGKIIGHHANNIDTSAPTVSEIISKANAEQKLEQISASTLDKFTY